MAAASLTKEQIESLVRTDADRSLRHLLKQPNRRRHGLTLDEFNELKASQNGRCYLCGEKPERLMLDHNHETGEARKFLCGNCNTKLGSLESWFRSVDLQDMLDYLKL